MIYTIICIAIIVFLAKTEKFNGCLKGGLIMVMFLVTFASCAMWGDAGDSSGKEEKTSIEQSDKEEKTESKKDDKKVESKEDGEKAKNNKSAFHNEFAERTSEPVASKLDLLFTQLGFTNPRLSSKEPDGLLFDVVAGGEHLKVSADKENVYSIFIPNVANFYMDGEIKQTLSEYKAEQKRKQNEQYDLINVNIMAEDLVKSYLVNPGSAKFPSIHSGEISFANNGNVYAVQAYVDSKNRMGAKVREKYLVEFRVIDINTYSYDPIYVQIGNQKVGEYIDFEQ